MDFITSISPQSDLLPVLVLGGVGGEIINVGKMFATLGYASMDWTVPAVNAVSTLFIHYTIGSYLTNLPVPYWLALMGSGLAFSMYGLDYIIPHGN
jgi:hypothetical protein